VVAAVRWQTRRHYPTESGSGELAERFGAIEFRFRLSFVDHTIHYRQVRAILRLALPFSRRFGFHDGRLRMLRHGRRPERAKQKLAFEWRYPPRLRACCFPMRAC